MLLWVAHYWRWTARKNGGGRFSRAAAAATPNAYTGRVSAASAENRAPLFTASFSAADAAATAVTNAPSAKTFATGPGLAAVTHCTSWRGVVAGLGAHASSPRLVGVAAAAARLIGGAAAVASGSRRVRRVASSTLPGRQPVDSAAAASSTVLNLARCTWAEEVHLSRARAATAYKRCLATTAGTAFSYAPSLWASCCAGATGCATA